MDNHVANVRFLNFLKSALIGGERFHGNLLLFNELIGN